MTGKAPKSLALPPPAHQAPEAPFRAVSRYSRGLKGQNLLPHTAFCVPVKRQRLVGPGAPVLSQAGAAAAGIFWTWLSASKMHEGPFSHLLALSPLTSMRSSWGTRISGSHEPSGVPLILGLWGLWELKTASSS